MSTILKSNSTCVYGFHTPLTARSHTKPPPSLGPVPCSRTTASGVTRLYAMEANCPTIARTSLWRRMMFPPFGQLRPWSSEKLFPQPSHTPGRANRGLLYRKARPSRNSRAERTVSFSLGMADSHAPVEMSFALLRLRCFRSPRAGMLASNFLKDSSLRLDCTSARALKTDSRWHGLRRQTLQRQRSQVSSMLWPYVTLRRLWAPTHRGWLFPVRRA